jgi:hypothetical protein
LQPAQFKAEKIMPNVYELTRGYQNIEQGNPLIFPNVLTCMAFVAYDGATLIGVHFTQLDQTTARVAGAWMRVQVISAGPHRVYIAGPGWNANLLANLVPAPASFHGKVVPRGSDVQATLAGGIVTLTYQSTGGGGPWLPLLP